MVFSFSFSFFFLGQFFPSKEGFESEGTLSFSGFMSAGFDLVVIGALVKKLWLSATFCCMIFCCFLQRLNLVNSVSMRLRPKRYDFFFKYFSYKPFCVFGFLFLDFGLKSKWGFGFLDVILQDLFWSSVFWDLSHKAIFFHFLVL